MHSERDEDLYGTGILFEEPKPNRSRPRDLIGLYKQQRKPQPRITQERARAATERRSGRNGAEGNQGMRRSPPEMGTARRRPRMPGRSRKERRTQTEQGSRRISKIPRG